MKNAIHEVQAFPRELYDKLVKDLIGTSEVWKISEQLHDISVEQYDLLDWAAYGFFLTVRRSLLHTAVIGIGRLLVDGRDPTSGIRSVSLLNLKDALYDLARKDEALKRDLNEEFRSVFNSAKNILQFRHKAIAHSASEADFTEFELAEIQHCLVAIWKFLNWALFTFTGVSQQGYMDLRIPHGANALIDLLERHPEWPEQLEKYRRIGWYD